jgi:hypothetical protein
MNLYEEPLTTGDEESLTIRVTDNDRELYWGVYDDVEEVVPENP